MFGKKKQNPKPKKTQKNPGRRLGTESKSLWHELMTAPPMNEPAALSCQKQRQGLPELRMRKSE